MFAEVVVLPVPHVQSNSWEDPLRFDPASFRANIDLKVGDSIARVLHYTAVKTKVLSNYLFFVISNSHSYFFLITSEIQIKNSH